MADHRTSDETAIRRIVADRVNALHARNAAALTAHDAGDILSYDLAPPLATRGVDAAGLERWLAGWDGPVTLEVRELNVVAGGEVAFATSLNRMQANARSDPPMDLWVRSTLGLRKIGGRWTVAHEHVSVHFYMDGSARAALDLQP